MPHPINLDNSAPRIPPSAYTPTQSSTAPATARPAAARCPFHVADSVEPRPTTKAIGEAIDRFDSGTADGTGVGASHKIQLLALKLRDNGWPTFGAVAGTIGSFTDGAKLKKNWSGLLESRREAYGDSFAALGGVMHTAHDDVMARAQDPAQKRGHHVTALDVKATRYFSEQLPSLMQNGEAHAKLRALTESMMPTPTAATKIADSIVAARLAEATKVGKLDGVEDIGAIFLEAVHVLLIGMNVSPEEIQAAKAWMKGLPLASLPNGLHAVLSTLTGSKGLSLREEVVTQYKASPKFAELVKANPGLSEDEIANTIFDVIFVGAFAGAGSLISSLVGVLARNPSLRDAVRDEARAKGWTPDQPISLELLAQLDTLDDTVWETARLFPPARFVNQVSQADETIQIGGADVNVPKGTRHILSLFHAGRDERAYDDPNAFRLGRDHGDTMSFNGAGHDRACPGQNLSINLAKIFALRVIGAHEFSASKDDIQWDMKTFGPFRPSQLELTDFRPAS